MINTTDNNGATDLVACVCLYGLGNEKCGAGWAADTRSAGMFGTCECKAGQTYNQALVVALETLRKAGVIGRAVVHAAGGEQVAYVHTLAHTQDAEIFAGLKWRKA